MPRLFLSPFILTFCHDIQKAWMNYVDLAVAMLTILEAKEVYQSLGVVHLMQQLLNATPTEVCEKGNSKSWIFVEQILILAKCNPDFGCLGFGYFNQDRSIPWFPAHWEEIACSVHRPLPAFPFLDSQWIPFYFVSLLNGGWIRWLVKVGEWWECKRASSRTSKCFDALFQWTPASGWELWRTWIFFWVWVCPIRTCIYNPYGTLWQTGGLKFIRPKQNQRTTCGTFGGGQVSSEWENSHEQQDWWRWTVYYLPWNSSSNTLQRYFGSCHSGRLL